MKVKSISARYNTLIVYLFKRTRVNGVDKIIDSVKWFSI